MDATTTYTLALLIGWGITLCLIALWVLVTYWVLQWMMNRSIDKRIQAFKEGRERL